MSFDSCELRTESKIDRSLSKQTYLSITIGGYVRIQEQYGEKLSRQLRTLVATNSVESLDIEIIAKEMPKMYDLEALEKAVILDERDDAIALYEERIQELEAIIYND